MFVSSDIYLDQLNVLCKLDDGDGSGDVPAEPVVELASPAEDAVEPGAADDDVVEDAHGQGADMPVEPVAAPPAPADDLVVNADGQGVDMPAEPAGGVVGDNDAHGQGADIPVEPVAAPCAPADLVVNADGQGVDIPAADDVVEAADDVVEEADDAGNNFDGDQVETLESLSDNHGPLANAHMPTSMVLISGSSNVRSLHPWRLDLFDPNNTARLSIPKNYKRIVKRRRNTVTRNYRAGRMYAILHDGRVAMSPDEDIQDFLDAQNEKRGRTITVQAWLDLVKGSIIRHKAMQMLKSVSSKSYKAQCAISCGTKRKYNRTVSEGKSAKRTAKRAQRPRNHSDIFNIDNLSDEETEKEN